MNDNIKKTKEALDKILAQAKDSVKVLETLQKEGLAHARNFMETQIPNSDKMTKAVNDKLVASLKKMGFATRSEVRDLEEKVEELASELRSQISKATRKSSTKDSMREKDTGA